jgi:hypothetical protein
LLPLKRTQLISLDGESDGARRNAGFVAAIARED